MELTSDALSFFLLGGDQFAGEVLDLRVAMPKCRGALAKRFFSLFALGDVDHESPERYRDAIFLLHTD